MPRFYFHYLDGAGGTADEEGQIFPDAAAALKEATLAAREAIADLVTDASPQPHGGSYVVTDEAGIVVAIIPFVSVLGTPN
jgi:hypothetical protein